MSYMFLYLVYLVYFFLYGSIPSILCTLRFTLFFCLLPRAVEEDVSARVERDHPVVTEVLPCG